MSEQESSKVKESKKQAALLRAKEQLLAIRKELLQDPEITESDLWAMEAQILKEEPEEAKEGGAAAVLSKELEDPNIETPRQAAKRLPTLAPTSGVTRVSREAVQQEAVRRILLRLF